MSFKAMTLVGERSRAKGSNLAMLRSIADYAKDDGRFGWPSVGRLAFDQRLTRRAAELILRKLVKDREVAPEWADGEERLYLHVRCVCDWTAYQQEGAIPEREKISRKTKRSFAQKLCRIATKAAHDFTELAKNPADSAVATITDPVTDPSLDPVKEPPRAAALTAGTPEDLAALWNRWTTPPVRPCESLTPKRRRHCRARLAERSLEAWAVVFARLDGSAFCRGDNERGWVASFDWAISSPDVSVKVLEGQYDDRVGRERPFSDEELRDARRVRQNMSGCPHDPACENWNHCVAAIIRKWRRDRGEAA